MFRPITMFLALLVLVLAHPAYADECNSPVFDTTGKVQASEVEPLLRKIAGDGADPALVRRAVSQAAADTQALNAVRKVQDLTTGVDSTHLGGALQKAKDQSAVAREELSQAVGGMTSSPEAMLQKSQAAARIAAMRAKAAAPTT